MKLICYSFSHDNTPLQVREALAFSAHRSGELQQHIINSTDADEALVLCTCNRTEIYITLSRENRCDILEVLGQFITYDVNDLDQHMRVLVNEDAVTHLFALACGLRSQVIGETEIMSQLKSSYVNAVAAGTSGRILNRTFQKAFAVSKKVRTGTDIGRYRVSVASVAVDQAQRICGEITGKKVAVWGTGQVGRAVVNSLMKAGVKNGVILSRSEDKAREMCSDWQWVAGNDFRDVLARSDIFFSCTGAPHPVITDNDVVALTKNLVIFDLALPRDVQIDHSRYAMINLIDLEALEIQMSRNQNIREKSGESILPKLIAEAEVFWKCLTAQKHSGCIADWRMQAHDALAEELLALNHEFPNMSQEMQKQLQILGNRLLHRMLHLPSVAMKKALADELPCRDYLLEALDNE